MKNIQPFDIYPMKKYWMHKPVGDSDGISGGGTGIRPPNQWNIKEKKKATREIFKWRR